MDTSTNPLAKTQRDRIREENEQENVERDETRPDDVNIQLSKEEDDETKVNCWPKCFLLGIALILLLAGLIVLIYFFRDKESIDGLRGGIYKDKKPREECPDISVRLGESITIGCKFRNNITGDVHAVYRNLVGAKKSDFECIKSINETAVTCTAVESAKCSSHGDVDIRLFDSYDDNKKLMFTKTVKVNVVVPDNAVYTWIGQNYSESSSLPEFHLMCEYEKDCMSYELGFFVDDNILPDTKSCTTSFSDDDGYSVACRAIVPSQEILKHGNQSRLYCRFMHGSLVAKKTEFMLPFCSNYSTWNANCSANTATLYDCNETPPIQRNCTRECLVAKECFPDKVQELPSSSVCPCAWKLCRNGNTSEIDTNGRPPFEDVCPDTS